ncbi:MAG: hypothetical protein P1V35_06165 [Planctomycetota bacterium]|nr:hypothetical protein [Planctomycetota bacterium]
MFKKLFGRKSSERFREPSNTAVFTCCHVLESGLPILFVSHGGDDKAWQFLCGTGDHSVAEGRMASLGQMVEGDASVAALYEMPPGVCATREQVGGEWTPFRS